MAAPDQPMSSPDSEGVLSEVRINLFNHTIYNAPLESLCLPPDNSYTQCGIMKVNLTKNGIKFTLVDNTSFDPST